MHAPMQLFLQNSHGSTRSEVSPTFGALMTKNLIKSNSSSPLALNIGTISGFMSTHAWEYTPKWNSLYQWKLFFTKLVINIHIKERIQSKVMLCAWAWRILFSHNLIHIFISIIYLYIKHLTYWNLCTHLLTISLKNKGSKREKMNPSQEGIMQR